MQVYSRSEIKHEKCGSFFREESSFASFCCSLFVLFLPVFCYQKLHFKKFAKVFIGEISVKIIIAKLKFANFSDFKFLPLKYAPHITTPSPHAPHTILGKGRAEGETGDKGMEKRRERLPLCRRTIRGKIDAVS